MDVGERAPDIRCRRIKRLLRAEPACEVATRRAEVDGDDVLVPLVDEGGQRGQTDGSAEGTSAGEAA